jgi:hypothetical protein
MKIGSNRLEFITVRKNSQAREAESRGAEGKGSRETARRSVGETERRRADGQRGRGVR